MHPNPRSRAWLWGLVIVVILAIIAVLLVLAANGTSSLPPTATTGSAQIVQVAYACDGGKTVDATYNNATTATTTGNSVMLVLSDGRQMTLPQAISADGARYANSDESFVFWSVGNTATITENGTTTYDNCVAQSQ